MDQARDIVITPAKSDRTAFLDAVHSPLALLAEVAPLTPDEWREAILSTVDLPSDRTDNGRPACIEPF